MEDLYITFSLKCYQKNTKRSSIESYGVFFFHIYHGLFCRQAIFNFLCNILEIIVSLFVLSLMTVVLSVLRLKDSNYLFSISFTILPMDGLHLDELYEKDDIFFLFY
jgi:hypothetical protein